MIYGKISIDFRKINLLELKNIGILAQDINDIFLTENLEIHEFIGFSYAIGYLNQRKFLHVAYKVSENSNFDIELLQADIPNEEDIKKYWCSRKSTD